MTGTDKPDRARADRERRLLRSRTPKSPRPATDVLDIVTESPEDDFALRSHVLQLVHARLPHWEEWAAVVDPNLIRLERISGAMTNCIFAVHGPPRKVIATPAALAPTLSSSAADADADAETEHFSLDDLRLPEPAQLQSHHLVSAPMLPSANPAEDAATAKSATMVPLAPLKNVGSMPTKSSYPLPLTDRCVPRRLLLRVYGVGMENFIQRDREIYWLRKLSETGYGARMLATFANGRFEEFLDADTLTKRDLRDPQVSALIASKVCQLHNLADQFPLSPGIERDRSAAPELWDSIGRYVTQVSDAMDAILETYPDRKARAEALGLNGRLTAALARIKQRLESLGSPVVFAHNDLQYGNLLRHSITREIVIVDYEYSSFNYRSYDIANHFCEWMADYHGDAPHVLAAAQFPTLAERQHFYRAYIEAHHGQFGAFPPTGVNAAATTAAPPASYFDGSTAPIALPSLMGGPVTAVPVPAQLQAMDPAAVNACVNAFDAEVMVSVLLSHAFWGLWGLVREADMLGRREIDFDFWEYGAQRIERLWADMETALAMQC